MVKNDENCQSPDQIRHKNVPASASRPEEEFYGLDQVNKFVNIFIDLIPPESYTA